MAVVYHGGRYLLFLIEDSMKTDKHSEHLNHSNHNTSNYQNSDREYFPVLKDESEPRNESTRPSKAEPISDGTYLILRLTHATVNALNYVLSMILMLVVMTYNPGLFLSVGVGYFVGDLIFYVKINDLIYDSCH